MRKIFTFPASNIVWPPSLDFPSMAETTGDDKESYLMQKIDIALGTSHTDGRSKRQLSEDVAHVKRTVDQCYQNDLRYEEDPYGRR